MTQNELTTFVAKEVKVNRTLASLMVKAYHEAVRKGLKTDEKVTLPGFGTFRLKKRRERPGKNPRTGEDIVIPEKTVVRFTPGKHLKFHD